MSGAPIRSVEARALEQRRQALEAGLGQERAAAAGADLAGAQRGVAVAVRGEAASWSRSRAGTSAASCPRARRTRPWWPPPRRPCARRSRWPAGGRSPGTGPAACRRRPARSARPAPRTCGRWCCPAPAVSSSSSGHESESASAWVSALPIRFIDAPCGSPTVEPGCSTTPSAPIASPICSECTSEAIDFDRISLSLDAQLIR